MASGPYFDKRRGTWTVQYWNGVKWCRPVVVRKRRGWKPGDPAPKKPPPEAIAELARYTKAEQEARERKGTVLAQSVKVFLETYRKTYAKTQEPSSTKELDKVIKLFLGWCEGQGIGRIDQVTPSICQRWITDRESMSSLTTGKPIQHATVRKERALLAAAWSRAARLKEIPDNPWTAALVEVKPGNEPKGSWSVEEYQRLLKVCHPWLKAVLILGCNTGLRIEALRCLEWRDIVWAKPGDKGFGWVYVRPELDKAGKGYRVPINEAIHELLFGRFMHRDTDAVFVLSGKGKKPIRQNNITDRAIRRACIKAGLATEENPIKSPNHHMRRTFGRWAVSGHLTGKPVPIFVVSKWYGHASIAMTMQYLAISEDDSTSYMLGEDVGGMEY
jgi:integrase